MHIHTYTCPSNPKVGKCAGKSSVTRTSTRGNTLLPSTLTLLIGLRVTHSWGCVYVCVCVSGKKAFFPDTHTHTYTHKHERLRVINLMLT